LVAGSRRWGVFGVIERWFAAASAILYDRCSCEMPKPRPLTADDPFPW
jgi:hypothetical protein